jgi:hypothetical protein
VVLRSGAPQRRLAIGPFRSLFRQIRNGLECLGVAGGYESDLFATKDLGTIGPIRTHSRTRFRIFAGFVKSPVLSKT